MHVSSDYTDYTLAFMSVLDLCSGDFHKILTTECNRGFYTPKINLLLPII